MTLDTYSHLLPDKQDTAVKALEGILAVSKSKKNRFEHLFFCLLVRLRGMNSAYIEVTIEIILSNWLEKERLKSNK